VTVLATLSILWIQLPELRLGLIFLAGIAFGIGQLSSLKVFWSSTQSQSRGMYGGLIALITVIFYFISRVTIAEKGALTESVLFGLIPTFFAILLLATYRQHSSVNIQKGNFPEKKTILLYALPWVCFCFINGTFAKAIDLPSAQVVSADLTTLILIQAVFSLIGVSVGGLIADRFGRRLSLALSVTLYGLSMAFSGFIQETAILFLAFSIEGLGWGILLTLYSFVIWGDLANEENCSKMYAIGLSIYCVSVGLGQLSSALLQIGSTASALIACSIIFLSNLPIILAPELLSSDALRRRRMNSYLKKVKKIAKNEAQG
jgi:hypothetical protein